MVVVNIRISIQSCLKNLLMNELNQNKRFSIPWYSDGVRFSCTQCGKCCTGSPGSVWITEEEIGAMALFLKLTISDFKRLYVKKSSQRLMLVEKKSENHSCIFYKDQKCQVYAARPLQCRSYPFWQENIHSEKSWKETAKECEGISPDGSLVSFEEIEQFLSAHRQQNPDDHFVASTL